MNEVANTSTIRCVVIIAENGQFAAYSSRCLSEVRNQITWRAYRKFTNLATWMGANRIEVTKGDSVHGNCLGGVFDNSFAHLLSGTIRALGGLLRRIFSDGAYIGLAIYGAG